MDDPALLDTYLAGPNQLRSAVAGLCREQLISRPVAGRWSVLEVVCHLVDTDANIAHRIKRVLSAGRPVFDRVKPEQMLAALAYHDREVEEELTLFDVGRRQIGRILRATPPEAWERTGVVGDRGERTVDQMINGAVEHLAHHLGFVIEKRRALGIDEMLWRAGHCLDVGWTSLDGRPQAWALGSAMPEQVRATSPRRDGMIPDHERPPVSYFKV